MLFAFISCRPDRPSSPSVPMTDIVIIGGCGHVGLPLGMSFAKAGKKVVAMDLDARKVAETNAGRMPFLDNGADELLPKAMAFAELLATKAPLAIGIGKLVLNKCLDVDLDTGRNFERLGQSILKRSSDHEEGARAFIEKRKPQFTGR